MTDLSNIPVSLVMSELSEIRHLHDLSQAVVAERMGVSQPAVSQLEAGATEPSLDTLSRYAQAIGVNLTVTATDTCPTTIRQAPILDDGDERVAVRERRVFEAYSAALASGVPDCDPATFKKAVDYTPTGCVGGLIWQPGYLAETLGLPPVMCGSAELVDAMVTSVLEHAVALRDERLTSIRIFDMSDPTPSAVKHMMMLLRMARSRVAPIAIVNPSRDLASMDLIPPLRTVGSLAIQPH